MNDQQEFSSVSIEQLRALEQKLKRTKTLSALAVGILAGVIIFGVAQNGFGVLYTLLPGAMIVGLVRNSKGTDQQLALVKQELAARQ